MKLGILKTGAPPPSAREKFGGYPDMFRKLLGETAFDYRSYAVDEGDWPAKVEICDAYLVTGSACGVYDPEPWIGELKAFLNQARGRTPLVGVCFGHQIMAEAFGGRAAKSSKGWGLGAHTYALKSREPWMDGQEDEIRLPASHQDQVSEPPPGADVFAASEFTPFGALAYRDQKAISIQLHPEFEPAYAIALIESRRGSRYSEDEANLGIASYSAPDDRARVGGWIRNFLSGATV